jgi:hypothetical protein
VHHPVYLVARCVAFEPGAWDGLPVSVAGLAKLATAVSTLGLVACSGSATGGSSSGDSGTGFVVAGTVGDSVTEDPLAGVSLCVLPSSSSSNCTTSSPYGVFTLMGLAATGSGFSASLADYVTENWAVTPVRTSSWMIYLRSTSDVASLAQQAAATFDGTTGAITFEVDGPDNGGLGGATIATSVGEVVYFDTNGTLDPSLTATVGGSGFVFEVPPGTVDVTGTASGLTCVSQGQEGWPPLASGATMSAPIVAGQLTRVHLDCH